MRKVRAALLCAFSATLIAAAWPAQQVTIEGTLVTSFCYLANDTMGHDHKDCAMECTRAGAPAGVVTAEGEYTPISAYVLKIVEHMEEPVRVTGALNQGMLVLSKFEVRDGDGWKEVDAGPAQDASAGPTESGTAVASRDDATSAFARMAEHLVGDWRGRLAEIDAPIEASFSLAGHGTALVEEIRRLDREDFKMLTVYHMADDELRLTHFCTMRNQPRLRATSVRDGGRSVEFELVDVSNLSVSGDRYTHRMIVTMADSDHASVTYIGIDEGVEGTLTAELTRVRRH